MMSEDAYKVWMLGMMELAMLDTPDDFLDRWARVVAEHRGWTLREARKQLDAHVKRGHFRKQFARRSYAEALRDLTPEQRDEVEAARC
jgi:hypothetical protein